MSDTKQFELGEIVSIYTGILCCQSMTPLYDLLEWMTGERPFTSQLPRFIDECKPYLPEQFPWLAEIDASVVTEDNFREWNQKQVEKYGDVHDVKPIHREDHEVIDPIEELRRMKPDAEIIIVKADDEKPYGNIS